MSDDVPRVVDILEKKRRPALKGLMSTEARGKVRVQTGNSHQVITTHYTGS